LKEAKKNDGTHVRLINVSSPPMSLIIVDIDCGAKKLISHEEAIRKLGKESIRG